MSKSRSRLISCYCGNSISTWATVTEISIPISSDSLARPPALGRLDYDFPTFFAQREPGSMLGPVVSIRLNWFSLRASTKKRRDQSRVSHISHLYVPALSIFVERVVAACVIDRTILGVRGEQRIRMFSSTSTRLGSSNDRVHSCESSRRIGTEENSFSLDSASLALSKIYN